MENCIFCQALKASQTIIESENFKLIYDIDPIQEGHLLLISKEHYMDIVEMPDDVLFELITTEKKIISILSEVINLKGVSVIQSNGTIMDEGTHFHVHLIPRYEQDCFWDNQQVTQHQLNTDKLKEAIRKNFKIK